MKEIFLWEWSDWFLSILRPLIFRKMNRSLILILTLLVGTCLPSSSSHSSLVTPSLLFSNHSHRCCGIHANLSCHQVFSLDDGRKVQECTISPRKTQPRWISRIRGNYVMSARIFRQSHLLYFLFPSIQNRLALIQLDSQTLFLYRFFERQR